MDRKTFLTFIRERIKGMEDGTVLTKSGRRYSYSGIGRQSGIINHLRDFEQKYGLAEADYMNDDWFMRFAQFLTDLGLKKNTINSNIRAVKTALRRYCRQNKIVFPVEEFTYGPEITTQIYNSITEINAMLSLNLKDKPLEYIRDAYVIQCFTGLRRGDLFTLLQNPRKYFVEENGRNFFRIITAKTQKTVVIPVGTRVLDILNRRKWDFKYCTIQNYNNGIKRVGKLAGITKNIEVNYTQNGKLQKEIFAKYRLMSSHTGRRSFATNAFLAGIPTLKIRQITGHSSEAMFLVYIRSDGMDSALTIADDPFFH